MRSRIALDQDVDEVKTTLRVSNTLMDKFRHLAIDKRTTINGLIITAMENYLIILDDYDKKAIHKTSNKK